MIHFSKVKSNPADIIPVVVICALAVIVFLNPFKDILNLSEICFYLALVLALVIFFIRRNELDFREPLGLPFLLFVLWAIASIFWAVDRNNTLHDLYPRLIKFIILYYLLILFINTRQRFTFLVGTLVASTGLFALGSLIYIYFILGQPFSYQLTLDHISPNHIGQVCLFATFLSMIFLSITQKWHQKVILALCFISTLAAILLTCSRSSLLALAGGTLILIYFSKFKKPFIIGFFTIMVSVFVLFSTNPLFKAKLSTTAFAQEQRIGIFATAVEMIKDRPIIGFGFGLKSFGDNILKYKGKLPSELSVPYKFTHAHNVFLDITTRLGLIGLVFFVCILFQTFRMAHELIKVEEDDFIRKWGLGLTACFISLLTAGFFENILTRRIGTLFYISMAMITILWKLHQTKTHKLP